jgi:hypothetical protein
MNEQARRVQMCVAGEIEVVDRRTFEGGCLLWADVGRKKQEPVPNVRRWQISSSAVQLIGYDAGVLMAEMSLFLDEVSDGSANGFPGNNPVKTGEGLPRQTDLGRWHPLLESGPVQIEIYRRPCHVHHNSMFINNEQERYMNDGES